MPLDTTRARSRRSLITAAAAAAAAATVATLGKPLAAAAADGDPLVVGTDNIATARTNPDGDLDGTSRTSVKRPFDLDSNAASALLTKSLVTVVAEFQATADRAVPSRSVIRRRR